MFCFLIDMFMLLPCCYSSVSLMLLFDIGFHLEMKKVFHLEIKKVVKCKVGGSHASCQRIKAFGTMLS